MKDKNYYLYLSDEEYRLIIASLVDLNNKLLDEGRYPDCVVELLEKTLNAKYKKIKVKYVDFT